MTQKQQENSYRSIQPCSKWHLLAYVPDGIIGACISYDKEMLIVRFSSG